MKGSASTPKSWNGRMKMIAILEALRIFNYD